MKRVVERENIFNFGIFILFIFVLLVSFSSEVKAQEIDCGYCDGASFCTQKRCESQKECMFVGSNSFLVKLFKLGSCIEGPGLSPPNAVIRSVSRSSIGVGCSLNVNLSVDYTIENFSVVEESLPNNGNEWTVSPGQGNTGTAGKIKWVQYSQTVPVTPLPDTKYTYNLVPISTTASGTFSGIYTMGDAVTSTINNAAGQTGQITVAAQVCGDQCRTGSELTNPQYCDDGNTIDGDGCSSLCAIEQTCGNGFREGTEECDDGNFVHGDNCFSCQSYCSYTNLGNENRVIIGNDTSTTNDNKLVTAYPLLGARFAVQDSNGVVSDGQLIGSNTGELTVGGQYIYVVNPVDADYTIDVDFLGTECSSPCGNSIVEAGESCDDGNLNDIDACNNRCQSTNVCGNNTIETGEICDDGNTVNGDKCSGGCLCSDTDGAKTVLATIGTKGTVKVYGNSASYVDKCINGKLEENYCNGNIRSSQMFTCSTGQTCNNGMCYGGGTCFLPDTMITTNDGKKMIKDIKVGDVVTSYDEVSNRIQSNKVTELYNRVADSYLLINGNLKVTPNHPMMVNGEWMEIGRAKFGDKLRTEKGEEKIFSIKEVKGSVEVFNLEVENDHTYYAQGYLAHNKGVLPPGTDIQ